MSDSANIKAVLIAEMDQLSHELSNGDAGNIEKQGKALAYILRIMRPLVERESVQESECRERMGTMGKRLDDHYVNCPAARLLEKPMESAPVIMAKLASTSLPWILFLVALSLWAYFK